MLSTCSLKRAALAVVLLAGCGRTPMSEDPCSDGCACVFDADCPADFVCVDARCINRNDFIECLANGAAPEVCNGRDDDCDGRIDDGQQDRTCERRAGDLVCPGTEVCAGAAGYVCDAPVPSVEVCDGVDNDCIGTVDDPFVDEQGRYGSSDHCGACGVRCSELLADAASTACELEEGAFVCRVVECPAGTFANEARTACLGLPDALCRPCAQDEDCLGPDSQCLIFAEGERGCGRDCGPESPYGEGCPIGYTCVDAQCRPQNDTCICGADNEGATRSCRILTCDGFQSCSASPGGFDWGACDISAWQETCDGLDNDCDGDVDNGFLNPASGRYESDLHCGQCNNDCTRRWVPEVDHAIGGCDASSVRPECRITSCTTETIGGTTFEWVDINGAADDGCECRRRLGNTTEDDPDVGLLDTGAASAQDENCDGIDGVIGDAVFVSESAPDGGDGSLARPFRRIQTGIDALAASGRRYVLVAEGVYRERLVVPEGAQIYGGYAEDFLRRDVLQLATIVQTEIAPGAGPAGTLFVEGVGLAAAPTVVAGLHVYGADASGAQGVGQPGPSSVAVWIRNSGPGLTLRDNVIRGGRGAAGGRGIDGATGFGRASSLAVDGGNGFDGARVVGPCPASTLALGGTAGINGICLSSNGRSGGEARCPAFDWSSDPVRGTQAAFQAPTTAGDGQGGFHRSFDDLSGADCTHVTESGFPSDFQTHNGADGQDGADGSAGTDGLGCRSLFGSFVVGEWTPGSAVSGAPGTDGSRGAGGGAGGGTARFPIGIDFCDAHEVGATGGGGGAGGCGGTGGLAGGSGGASIAVLITDDAPAGPPNLRSNRIERGPGGRGGDGGFGGPGGQGGRGGFGGRPGSWSGSTGGKGGDGGNGGVGGGGGGGCGGPSVGWLAFETMTDSTANTFTVDDAEATGGVGGAGGNGVPAGAGLNGGATNVLRLVTCDANGACPAGTSCDSNQICVPVP